MTRRDATSTADAARSRPSAAIGAIPVLPVYVKLRGRRVLLAGASLPAVWKAQLLAAAGAHVTVCDPAPCPEMVDFAQDAGDALAMVARLWTPPDLENCGLAVGALEGEEATRFRDAARDAGVPVNVIDVPELCDFQFGTIIDRSPLLIGISTDGAAPVLGQALRTRIEALLPPNIREWAEAAKTWRGDLQDRHLGFAARRAFWETFAALALDGPPHNPAEPDRAACLGAALREASENRGILTLVGVGPGEPDLVTLRAVRALQAAEVMIHDEDVAPEILNLGRREALRHPVAHDEAAVSATSEQLERHRRVVWVGLGDPATSLRWRKRQRLLAEGGASFEVAEGLPYPNDPGPDDAV